MLCTVTFQKGEFGKEGVSEEESVLLKNQRT